MSCSRGNTVRSRPQKHQNRTAFRNDLHDTSKKTKTIKKLEISGVCERCKGIIEWKIKYKKYKPLTAPSKCVNCNEKAVKFAYHMLCCKCAKEKKSCAKCMKPRDIESDIASTSDNSQPHMEQDLKTMLQELSERKRRSLLRAIKKQGGDSPSTQELQTIMEEWMANVKLEEHDQLSDDENSSNSEGTE